MKLLFFDDYHLQYRRGLSFQAHQPEKHAANPIIVPEHPWEAWRAFPISNCVVQENGQYRMWYETGYDEASFPGDRLNRTAYATSSDGLHWEKPPLGQYEYQGSKENNILNLGPFGVHDVSVVRDDHEPNPLRRYKMSFFGHPPGRGRLELPLGIRTAHSENGLHWKLTRAADDPAFRAWRDVVPGRHASGDTHALVGWVPERERYVIMTRSMAIDPRNFRTICYSESEDFVNWSSPVNVLSPDEQDAPGMEFYYMTVQRYEDVYLGHLCIFHNYSRRLAAGNPDRFRTPPELEYMNRRLDTKLVYSRDLQVWRYADVNRGAFVPVGDGWDSGMVFGSSFVNVNGEHWFYYGGTPMRHIKEDLQYAGTLRDGLDMTMCTGVARLRQDGFVSLYAGDSGGECITQPVTLTRLGITLNARTPPDGQVMVQVLDAQTDTAITTSAPVQGDGLALPLTFDGDLPTDAPVRLRIQARGADVFSLTV